MALRGLPHVYIQHMKCNLHAISCCKVSMNKFMHWQILHSLCNLMTYPKHNLACWLNLQWKKYHYMQTKYPVYIHCTSSSVASLLSSSSFLWCRMYSSTLPLDINGIMSRGIAPSKHTPWSDITLVWSKDIIVETSFIILSKSCTANRARNRYTKCAHMHEFIVKMAHAELYLVVC